MYAECFILIHCRFLKLPFFSDFRYSHQNSSQQRTLQNISSKFNDNTNKKQSDSLSIIPENDYKKIEYIAFSFLYAYNENEIMAYNTMRNISLNGYIAEETSSD